MWSNHCSHKSLTSKSQASLRRRCLKYNLLLPSLCLPRRRGRSKYVVDDDVVGDGDCDVYYRYRRGVLDLWVIELRSQSKDPEELCINRQTNENNNYIFIFNEGSFKRYSFRARKCGVHILNTTCAPIPPKLKKCNWRLKTATCRQYNSIFITIYYNTYIFNAAAKIILVKYILDGSENKNNEMLVE